MDCCVLVCIDDNELVEVEEVSLVPSAILVTISVSSIVSVVLCVVDVIGVVDEIAELTITVATRKTKTIVIFSML